MKKVKAIFYFINEWWAHNFFTDNAPPAVQSADELDRIYLARKRFLFENFGEFGQGEEHPVIDDKYANYFVKWGMDIIAYILGGRLAAHEAGGYHVIPAERETLEKLEPVDVADTPFAEWILKRKEYLKERYGSAGHIQLLETSLNMATRLRGQEFFIDLGADKPFAAHLLEVIAQTTLLAYRFFCKEFVMPDANLTNCTINQISPDMYEEMCLPNDIFLAENTKGLFPDMDRHVCIHNCDRPADRYMDRYVKVPYVYRFEASYRTDIQAVRDKMPGVRICTLFNPVDMVNKSEEEFDRIIYEKTKDGVDEWIFWGIDPYCSIERLKRMLAGVQQGCAANGFEADLEMIPFNFDELEWSFPRWQGDKIYSMENAHELRTDIN